MKCLLIITLLLCACHVFSQDKVIINTDTSRIEIDTFRNQRIEEEFLKNKNLIRWTYYNERNIIETKGYYDTVRHFPMGVWEEFDPNGKLIRVENYDNRTWQVFDEKLYPYKSYLDKIKLKADKLIIDAYGLDFFKKHIKWDFGQCATYGKYGGGSWTDPLDVKPDSFLLRYDIYFDNGKLYDDMIEFNLNSEGQLIFPFDLYDETKGFEKLAGKTSFSIDDSIAIEKAKDLGLVETDTTKAEAFLYWEYFDDKIVTQFNGQYRFYVIIKVDSIKDLNPKGRSTVIDKFDVYVFNPWTGAFIIKKKMKTIRGWEQLSGSSSGLLPDK